MDTFAAVLLMEAERCRARAVQLRAQLAVTGNTSAALTTASIPRFQRTKKEIEKGLTLNEARSMRAPTVAMAVPPSAAAAAVGLDDESCGDSSRSDSSRSDSSCSDSSSSDSSSSDSDAEAKPSPKRFRRSKAEMAANLSVEEAVARRAAVVGAKKTMLIHAVSATKPKRAKPVGVKATKRLRRTKAELAQNLTRAQVVAFRASGKDGSVKL